MANFTINIKELTSAEINASTIPLGNAEPVFYRDGSKLYFVIGDGTTQIRALPRLVSAETVNISDIPGLAAALSSKLGVAQGAGNANKILITDASGNVVMTVNNFMTKPASAATDNIPVFDANKNVIDSGVKTSDFATAAALTSHVNDANNPHKTTASQVGAYTKEQTDSAIADATLKEFATNADWEAADLATLISWINTSDNTAHDTVNNRDINNFDVYLALDVNQNYYFDSGAWILFGGDLTKYYTKTETDGKFATKDDLTEALDEFDVTPEGIGAMPKPDNAVTGNIAKFNALKQVIDGGISVDDILTIMQNTSDEGKILMVGSDGKLALANRIDCGTI